MGQADCNFFAFGRRRLLQWNKKFGPFAFERYPPFVISRDDGDITKMTMETMET